MVHLLRDRRRAWVTHKCHRAGGWRTSRLDTAGGRRSRNEAWVLQALSARRRRKKHFKDCTTWAQRRTAVVVATSVTIVQPSQTAVSRNRIALHYGTIKGHPLLRYHDYLTPRPACHHWIDVVESFAKLGFRLSGISCIHIGGNCGLRCQEPRHPGHVRIAIANDAQPLLLLHSRVLF